MQYILSLLPLLACPVGMGLMMWFMMRGKQQDQVPQRTDPSPASTYRAEPSHESPRRNSVLQLLFMCLNWKVVAGLAVVGIIVWAVAPQYLVGAIPMLIIAACPLSMLLMMRGMQGDRRSPRAAAYSFRRGSSSMVSHSPMADHPRASCGVNSNCERSREGDTSAWHEGSRNHRLLWNSR